MRSCHRTTPLSATILGSLIAIGLATTQHATANSPSLATSATPAAAADDLARIVSQLVIDLGSNQKTTRDNARRRLLTLGPDVLKLLPPADSIKNPTIRNSIRRLRRTLQLTAASRSAQASLVSLSGQHTLQALVASIAKQTGNPLQLGQLAETQRQQLVRLELDRATYWHAVDSLRSMARLDLVNQHGIATLVPVSNSPAASTTDHSIARSGPFRVIATSKAPRKIAGSDQRLIRLRLEWMAEPRLRPLYLVCRPANFQATGRFENNQPKPLAPRSPAATLELPLAGDNPTQQLRLDFVTPSAKLPHHVSLSGTADVWLAADTQPFSFPAKVGIQPVVKRRAGVAVVMTSTRITPADKQKHNVRVDITVQYESGGPSFESHRLWMLYNQAHLLVPGRSGNLANSKTTRQIDYDRFETPRLNNGTARLVYRFHNVDGPLENCRFVYLAPTQIIKVAVPLEFQNWPLAPIRSDD